MSEKFFLAAFIRNASNNRGRYNIRVVASSVVFYLAESIVILQIFVYCVARLLVMLRGYTKAVKTCSLSIIVLKLLA